MNIASMRRLVMAASVAITVLVAACGTNQHTFIPNCLPSAESGPNAVAKVRYKVTSTNKDRVEEAKTFDTKLGEPFELPSDNTIKLPISVELLNADGTVLATRTINDPELVRRSANYPVPDVVPGGSSKNPDKTVIYISSLGNRYEDTWEFIINSRFEPVYIVKSRKVSFVDVESAAIACTTLVPRPSPWPTPGPSDAAAVAHFEPEVLNLKVGEKQKVRFKIPENQESSPYIPQGADGTFSKSGIASMDANSGEFLGLSPGTVTYRAIIDKSLVGLAKKYDISLTINVTGDAQVVSSLQGLTETTVLRSSNPARTLVSNTNVRSQVTDFIQSAMSQHAGHNLTLNAADGLLRNWDQYVPSDFPVTKGFPDVGQYTAQFKSANGQVWKVSGGIFGGKTDPNGVEDLAWQFPATVPDSLFTGDQAKGRLELILPFANGQKELVIHSQEFILAEKATAPTLLTVPLTATNTASLPLQNKVTFACTTDGKAQGLYDAVRKSSGGTLPEQSVTSYYQFDQLWQATGGTVETFIQPGTVVGQTYTANGARVVATSVNPLPAEIDLNLPWPSSDIFNRFKSGGLQNPVTGWLAREYSRNGQVLVTLISPQVTWGTAPKEVIQQQQAGGGVAPPPPAPALPYTIAQNTNDTTANISAAAKPGQTFTTTAAGNLASVAVFLTSTTTAPGGPIGPGSCSGAGVPPLCDPMAMPPSTFIPPLNGPPTPANCNVTLKVYAVAAGVPTGGILAQQTAVATHTTGGMVTFTFGAPLAVTGGTTYAFTLETGGTDTATAGITATNPYAGGTFLTNPTTATAGSEMRFTATVQ